MKAFQATRKGRIARIVVAMLLCCAMMIGATYAWFSDSATTGINTITAGNLDVELMYSYIGRAGTEVWADAKDHPIFDAEKMELWEPGKVVLSDGFKVVNAGSLALKYQLTLNVVEEKKTTTGKSLSDVIKLGVLDAETVSKIEGSLGKGATEAEIRKAYIDAVKSDAEGENKFMSIADFTSTGALYPKDESSGQPHETGKMYLVLYWEPNGNDVDNLYNGKEGSVTFGLHVNATQAPHESDSFGQNYDADA